MPAQVPHALYRMFNAEDALLYVGISKNFGLRWKQEAAEKPWWPEVKRQTVDWYDSKDEASAAEWAAIAAERPLHNVSGIPLEVRRLRPRPARPDFPPPPEWSDDDRARVMDEIREILVRPDLTHADARLTIASLLATGSVTYPRGAQLEVLARACGVGRSTAYRSLAIIEGDGEAS